MPLENQKRRRLLGPLFGIALGGLAGAILRVGPVLFQHLHPSPISGQDFWFMTLAFLVFGPIAIGFVAVRVAQAEGEVSLARRITLPWFAVLLGMGAAMVCALEGAVCLIFALPITFFFGSIGGVAAGVMAGRDSCEQNLSAAVLLLLPIVGAPLEARLHAPLTVHTVENVVEIEAPAEVVWRHIERVAPIAHVELRDTWAQHIGFPRPVEATLSFEGVGGVRHATFERGLMFVETVTHWEPERDLQFSIKADTKDLPPTTLDQHVTIGGRYFDVLDGEYRIEPLSPNLVRLHLTSHERLSTDFNWYAGMWSDAVMKTLQGSILEVIQRRCEAAAAGQEASRTGGLYAQASR